MSNPSSSRKHQNLNAVDRYYDDNEHANSDQMFNALINQYLSHASSSTSSPSAGYTPTLLPRHTDTQSVQDFQRVPSPSPVHGHALASRSSSWGLVIPNANYRPLNGSGQPILSFPDSGAHLHAGEQPTFSDLMREMSHERSRALHEAARRAPFIPIIPTGSSPQQAMAFSPGEYLYNRSTDLTQSPHRGSRSSSGSLSGSSASGQQGTGNIEDDALFEMFPCDMCTASFSRRHDLERHRRGHSGEAPYTCEGCGGGFTRSDGRGRHWKLQSACEARHFERGGSGKKRSGAGPGPGPGPSSNSGSAR